MLEIKISNFKDFEQYIGEADYRIFKVNYEAFYNPTLKLMLVIGNAVITHKYNVKNEAFSKVKKDDTNERIKVTEKEGKRLGFIEGSIEEFVLLQQV